MKDEIAGASPVQREVRPLSKDAAAMKIEEYKQRRYEALRIWKKLRRPNRSWRPVDRVRTALERISRDRFLDGEQVSTIAESLAACCSDNPRWTAKSAYAACCEAVGMLRGKPPAHPFEPEYGDYLKALHHRKPANAELAILQIILKGKTNGR